jgi:alpha-glucoside transport system permease protein
MKPFSRLNHFFKRLPLNLVIIVLCVIWIVPTLGVFITSFRSREAVRTSGWWEVFKAHPVEGVKEYSTYCASCHGLDGKAIPEADLSDPELVAKYPRSNRLMAMLRKDINGTPHLVDPTLPEKPSEAQAILAPILEYMYFLSGGGSDTWKLSLSNYADALVGYKGTGDYLSDCEQGVETTLAKFDCDISDILSPEGMGRAFINTMLVTIPAALIPILFAAVAAYAFAWMDFPGRMWLFAMLVGLQIIPLQMALVPIAKLYTDLGIQGTYFGILFHTASVCPMHLFAAQLRGTAKGD